ncbi:MAG TPA: hypothetical protein VII73_14080 [Caulobacteraceae bacterium]
MSFSEPWRMFRRMQASVVAAAALIYAAAVVNAWRVLPGGDALKLQRTALFPALYFALSLVGVLTIAPVRNAVLKHLWISFRTGYGQSVISVLVGVGVLAAAGGFIVWQTQAAAHGGRYPAGAFAGYGAGIGLLLAQAFLVRRIERDPALRRQIEEL